MKCINKKCEKRMEVDINNQRYICECGSEIKWMKERDKEEENVHY